MRRTLLLCVLALGSVATFSCSGGSTTLDAGADAAIDVSIDLYQVEAAPPKPVIVDIAAGAEHTCMVISYGQQYVTYCFGIAAALGGTAQGILAVATNGVHPSPNLVSIASSHGASHTCGIDDDHQVWCWGDNTDGQCGQGNTNTPVTAPQLGVDLDFGITQASPGLLAAGTSTSCVVRPIDGKLECFGDNTSCESDLYSGSTCTISPTASTPTTDTAVVFTGITSLAEGALHGCVAGTPYPTGTGALFCYGDNTYLESGPAGNAITTPAAKITTSAPVVSLAAGDVHTCFVTNSTNSVPHQLYCFGKNDVHEASPTLTTSPIDPTTVAPIALPGGATPLTVAVRAAETCVADVTGNMWCFGTGHGTNIDPVMGVKNVGKMVLGSGHTCVIANLSTDATNAPPSVICWGDNTNGQCGQTAGGTISTPTAVTIPASAP